MSKGNGVEKHLNSSLMEKAKISHALYHIVSVYFLEVCQATWHL